MICVTQFEEDNKSILRVEGWLQSEDVEELRRLTEAAGSEVALDLSELRMTSEKGIELLRLLSHRGIELLHMSPLIALLLRGNQENHPNSKSRPKGESS